MKKRLAACQILSFANPAESADKVLFWMAEAAAAEVDVVAFPEACLCGYSCDEAYWRTADRRAFLAAEARVVAEAARLQLGVVLGTVHWEGDALFNSLLVIGADGRVRGRYAKTHLAESWPQAGQHLPVYEVGGAPSCFIICHDVRYPELVRLPAAAGAKVCYYCSNESGLLAEHKLSAYQAMPIARAAENGIFLVMANAPANARDLHSPSQSHGNSKIVHPDGNILAEAGFFTEELVMAEVDLEEATGGMARRSTEDETILRDWMRQGVALVERPV